jgi:hypothetical protein
MPFHEFDGSTCVSVQVGDGMSNIDRDVEPLREL